MSDENWARNTLQKWKPVIDSFDIDFEEQEKLGALAKRDKRVMKLVLKELEYTDADNREHYAGSIALLLGRAAAQEAIPSLRKILMNKRESEPMRFSAARAIGLMGMVALPDLADVIIKSRDVLE